MKSINFRSKTFCFSGEFVAIDRNSLKKKIEARGGKLLSDVTLQLDYLIIGDAENPNWSSSGKGNKIKKAEDLFIKRGTPLLVKVTDLISVIDNAPVVNNSSNNKKVSLIQVILFSRDEILFNDFKSYFIELARNSNSYLTHNIYPIPASDKIKTTYRLLKELDLQDSSDSMKNQIENHLSKVSNIEFEIKYSEKFSDSSDYFRLLKEIKNDII